MLLMTRILQIQTGYGDVTLMCEMTQPKTISVRSWKLPWFTTSVETVQGGFTEVKMFVSYFKDEGYQICYVWSLQSSEERHRYSLDLSPRYGTQVSSDALTDCALT